MQGYQSDWRRWELWCEQKGHTPLPAPPAAVAAHLEHLAEQGSRLGSIARARSAIRLVHQANDFPDPSTSPAVQRAWRTLQDVAEIQNATVAPLRAHDLWQVVDACPTMRSWKANRPDETSLTGLRDRVLLLVGHWCATRPGELLGLTWDDVEFTPDGAVLTLRHHHRGMVESRSVTLVRKPEPRRCPVQALHAWHDALPPEERHGIVIRPVNKGNRAMPGAMTTEAGSSLLRAAIRRAGLETRPEGKRAYSLSSLRAGFVADALATGVPLTQLARNTGHKSLRVPQDDD